MCSRHRPVNDSDLNGDFSRVLVLCSFNTILRVVDRIMESRDLLNNNRVTEETRRRGVSVEQ